MSSGKESHIGKKVSTIYLKDGAFYVSYVFKKFGFEPIYLDVPSENELSDVSEHLSSEYCFPLKMMIADLYAGLMKGADIVIGPSYGMFKLIGPCKTPYIIEYKTENILKKSVDKDFQYLVFNFYRLVALVSWSKMLSKLGINMKNPLNISKLKKAHKVAARRGQAVADLENVMREVRAKAENPQIPIEIFNVAVKKLRDIYEEKEWKSYCAEVKEKLLAVPQKKDHKPLRIGIVGDYYAISGNLPQFDVENFLSKKFGAHIVQPYIFSQSIVEKQKKKYAEQRVKYNKYWVGGSDIITLGAVFELKEQKVDGIIQLKTFGCTPEDMVTLAIEEIKTQEPDLPPVLVLTFDEHSSPEGLKTRLEAFCNTITLKE